MNALNTWRISVQPNSSNLNSQSQGRTKHLQAPFTDSRQNKARQQWHRMFEIQGTTCFMQIHNFQALNGEVERQNSKVLATRACNMLVKT